MAVKVLVVSLGGTITMTPGTGGGIVPTLGAADLVATVPGLESVAAIEAISALSKPGASLTIEDIHDVARLLQGKLAEDFSGAVVIQGTDTLEETAFILDRLLGLDKPVVVTGAMRGSKEAGADGPRNILAATIVAASSAARGLGVLVVLNDEIHSARFVQKSHTALPSSFRSPMLGPWGLVVEGRAQIFNKADRLAPMPGGGIDKEGAVALIKVSLGDDGRLLSALPGLGFTGAVIEGFGVGHVPSLMVPLIADLVASMPVVLASRVDAGPTFSKTYGFPGSEIDLISRGVISAGSLSGLKARLLLLLLLRSGADRIAIKETFASFA